MQDVDLQCLFLQVSVVATMQQPMSDESIESAKNPKLVWADAPWTVAALLGIWGVMIGIEEFKLADAVMVLTGLSFAIRLFRDSIETKPRRIASFIAGVLLIVFGTGADIHFTKRKQIASEAKAQEIPTLHSQIEELQGTIAKQKKELETRDSRAEQQLSDIKQQNTGLRKSVETKDAALIDIAKQQYSLNFLPQVVVMWSSSTNDIRLMNNGKTNITIAGLGLNGVLIRKELAGTPAFLAPGANEGFVLTDESKQTVLSQAMLIGTKEVLAEGVAYIQTLDEKKYEVSFTVHFVVEAGAIAKTFVADKETKPSDWSGLQ